jgi:hypothetical protein
MPVVGGLGGIVALFMSYCAYSIWKRRRESRKANELAKARSAVTELPRLNSGPYRDNEIELEVQTGTRGDGTEIDVRLDSDALELVVDREGSPTSRSLSGISGLI